jgi:hypothetical protein
LLLPSVALLQPEKALESDARHAHHASGFHVDHLADQPIRSGARDLEFGGDICGREVARPVVVPWRRHSPILERLSRSAARALEGAAERGRESACAIAFRRRPDGAFRLSP